MLAESADIVAPTRIPSILEDVRLPPDMVYIPYQTPGMLYWVLGGLGYS